MLKTKSMGKYIQIYDPFRNIKYNLSNTSWEIVRLLKKYPREQAVKKIMEKFNIDRQNAEEDIETILKNFDILQLTLEDIPTKVSTEKYAPRRVQFDITPRCNLKCIYCLSSNLMAHNEEIPKNIIIKVLEKLYEKDMWVLVLSGGEPLTRKDIFDILDYTESIDIVTWLYTNGTLINEETARKLSKYKKLLVQVSLDSSNPKHNDMARGVEGALEKTVNGIKNLIKYNIIPTIAITATPINFDDIEDTIGYLYNLGIKQVRMAPAQVDNAKGEINKDKLYLDEEKIKLLGKKIGSLNNKYEGKMSFSVSPNMFDYPLNPELIETLEVGCEGGKELIYISPNGDVFPCYTLSFPDFKAGNILKDDILDIWKNSKVLEKFRNLKIEDLEKCKNCAMVDKCSGGCRGLAFARFKRITAPDPVYCSFFLDKNYLKDLD